MANQIPLSGAANASGGYLLPPEQGEILVDGILVETGAIQIAGDARSTNSRKTNFPIWLGRPTAGPVGEGGQKGITGAAFGQSSLNVQKFASIVLFTDEQIEDLQNGDLNVLVDAGVRQALSVSTDAHGCAMSGGAGIASTGFINPNAGGTNNTVFDSGLGVCSPGVGVTLAALDATHQDRLQKGVSAAMGQLEVNGYGDPADMAVLLGFGFQQELRDARDVNLRPIYDGGAYAGQSIDALYGLDRAHSTNLASTTQDRTATVTTVSASSTVTVTASPNQNVGITPGAPITGAGIPASSFIGPTITGGPLGTANVVITLVNAAGTAVNATASASVTATLPQLVGTVVHKPNIHVRIRQDVSVSASNEATIWNGGTHFDLFQDNLTALRYEMRLAYLVHDQPRAIIPMFL